VSEVSRKQVGKAARQRSSAECKLSALVRASEKGGRVLCEAAHVKSAAEHAWCWMSRENLRRQGLRAKAARKFKATTNSNHCLPVAKNLLKQGVTAQSQNQVWVADISVPQQAA
jgi:transposase InsO family protein